MEQTDSLPSIVGSVAGISARLTLWGRRASQGLARVSFTSDHSRQAAEEDIQSSLALDSIPYHHLTLPQSLTAAQVVAFLMEHLARLPGGMVSITGWATAFDEPFPHVSSLRVLNQNRENLAQFPLCQIWWMTPRFTDALLQTSPDLASWFLVRLNLTEDVVPQVGLSLVIPRAGNTSGTLEEARRLSSFIVERFQEALKKGFSFIELAGYAVRAAEELHKVGAEVEEDRLLDELFAQLQPFPKAADILNQLQMLPKQDALLIAKSVGFLFWRQANYEDAELLIKQALSLRQELFGAEDSEVAKSLNDLALVYDDQAHYHEAERLYQKAITIAENAFGLNSLQAATHLSNLAASYDKQGRFAEAEPLLHRARQTQEQMLRPDHPDIALTLVNIATLYNGQGRFDEAERLLQQALVINEKEYGQESRQVAIVLSNLGYLWMQQSHLEKAKKVFTQALLIEEKVLGADHPETALSLNNLGGSYFWENRFGEAEPLLQRAVAIAEKILGPEHPDTILYTRNYRLLLQEIEREKEAQTAETAEEKRVQASL